ncbi:hypothetical protein ACLESO_29805 [Pyxidicoccus sp. 3LG]
MKRSPAEMLQLLLSRASTRRPFLEQGLPAEAAGHAPEPAHLPGRADVPWLEAENAHPDDLAAQRWGVIAPEGPEGDAMLDAIAPLIQLREQEQGAKALRYRAPPDLDETGAVEWRKEKYRVEQVPEEERPKYLLMLGDLHQLPIALQHVLAQGSYVGRLHVARPSGEPDLEGYAAYARKVRAFETGTPEAEAPDVLTFVAADGSEASGCGRELLVEPFQALVESRWKAKRPSLRLRFIPNPPPGLAPILQAGAEARSGVLLSVSHGLGLPTQEESEEAQRALQGALDLGNGDVLGHEQLRDVPFLPGGMWFCLACFGAATPSQSEFHPWLAQLAEQGVATGPLDAVLECLPGPGRRPFVAALPQAALANPRGPLAILGHSDLAWAFSFAETDGGSLRSRASRIASVLEILSKGSRAGVALGRLMKDYQEANNDLTAYAHARKVAEQKKKSDPVDPKKHSYLWMLRNDLRGYILLGDPAARLSLRRAAA